MAHSPSARGLMRPARVSSHKQGCLDGTLAIPQHSLRLAARQVRAQRRRRVQDAHVPPLLPPARSHASLRPARRPHCPSTTQCLLRSVPAHELQRTTATRAQHSSMHPSCLLHGLHRIGDCMHVAHLTTTSTGGKLCMLVGPGRMLRCLFLFRDRCCACTAPRRGLSGACGMSTTQSGSQMYLQRREYREA